jgi:NADPH:quinone reductase-like Zn-dependent oxidoreductase
MAPIKQRAAFVSESGLTFGPVDVTKPGPGQILVKVVAAAQNPVDCQFSFFCTSLSSELEVLQRNSLTSALRILCDRIQGGLSNMCLRRPSMAESWVTISQASLRSLVRMFLRVCGPSASASQVSYSAVSFSFGAFSSYIPPSTERHTTADQANGAFSEYVDADVELQVVPIPGGWSFEEAAQLDVAPLTALQGSHESLELPSPFEARSTAEQPQRTILIWGGASALGQYAIQFAKLGGFRVVTTASSKNFDLVKGLGADSVFDYRDEGRGEDSRSYW